jgi:hypothetical protein
MGRDCTALRASRRTKAPTETIERHPSSRLKLGESYMYIHPLYDLFVTWICPKCCKRMHRSVFNLSRTDLVCSVVTPTFLEAL